MSSPARQRYIRAVRLLPGAVRVGSGGVQPPAASAEPARNAEDRSEGQAVRAAEAEIRKLKSELRTKESELADARTAEREAFAKMEVMKADVEREKSSLRESARIEAESRGAVAFAKGQEEGLAKGYSDGLVKAEADVRADYENRFSNALKLLAGINESLAGARERMTLSHAPQLVRLWEMMLRKMLQTGVKMDPEVVCRVLRNILNRVSDRERILIYLNGADVEMIEGSKEALMDSIRGVKFFEILSDEHVDRGSCLIETNLGIYDARWRTQLEQVSSEVEGLLMEVMASDESRG
ncbi:MAG: flagellar assembly protein FliH [Synergistaceae bacterium]|nr:flagellar assembly protein FliH [Synergistaceae bacterium]